MARLFHTTAASLNYGCPVEHLGKAESIEKGGRNLHFRGAVFAISMFPQWESLPLVAGGGQAEAFAEQCRETTASAKPHAPCNPSDLRVWLFAQQPGGEIKTLPIPVFKECASHDLVELAA